MKSGLKEADFCNFRKSLFCGKQGGYLRETRVNYAMYRPVEGASCPVNYKEVQTDEKIVFELCCFVVYLPHSSVEGDADTVTISDANLRAAIESALGKAAGFLNTP